MTARKPLVLAPSGVEQIQAGDTLLIPLTDSHIFVGASTGFAADVALSNDATLADTGALTLATVNANVGSYTNANITVNAKGLVTAAASGSSPPDQYTLTNGNASPIVIGSPVYANGTADTVNLAEATTSAAVASVIGLVHDTSIASGSPGNILIAGVLTATTVQWDARVTGESGGLTPGARYYLSDAAAGKLVTVAPTTTGSFVAPVGIALSATEMLLQIGLVIEL